MVYDDEKIADLSQIENMAKEYNNMLKEKGFVFVNLDEIGKNMLVKEVMETLFKLRASYRSMQNFLSSLSMYELTNNHIEKMRQLFSIEENTGFFVRCNNTKCFLNSVSLENNLTTKLLFLSQKCGFGEEIFEMIFERTKLLSSNLAIENCLFSNKNTTK